MPNMPVEWSVGHIPYKRAMVSPHKTAIIYEDIPITYQELNERDQPGRAHLLVRKGHQEG
ncbi:MAG: hypothetical protein MZV70_39090 [Desulfobacterales bacterium]|nr:hypothetical protein [Desulfobacterales bacterium]